MTESIYKVPIETMHGELTTLIDYHGQVMLIVNVASRCGFTSQYHQLESWYRKYKESGFIVLGFPCNQFAQQEPDDNSKIKEFAKACFAVTFPLFAKVNVNGINQAPIYRYLKQYSKSWYIWKNIPWNFTKYLINRKGEVCYRFWPIVPRWWVEKRIHKLLNQE
jgi:glutathione peroxidase